jgi:YD repeat-containing protein
VNRRMLSVAYLLLISNGFSISMPLQKGQADLELSVGSPMWQRTDTYWMVTPARQVERSTSPATFILFSAGKGMQTFKQVESFPAEGQSALFDRYRTVQDKVSIYQRGQSGEHIVIVFGPNGRTTTHLYKPDGERLTFDPVTQYPMYSQTPAQQLRSAQANDPEGAAASSPKTTFEYLPGGKGLLSRVTDEAGRQKLYGWDALTRRLLSVRETGPNGTGTTGRVDMRYKQIGRYHFLSEAVTYTPDGFGGEQAAATLYRYAEVGSGIKYRVLLRSKSTQILAAGNNPTWLTTIYTHDAQDRVVREHVVSGLNEDGPQVQADITTAYQEDALFGGLKKTTTQGQGQLRQERVQFFDAQGRLRRENVWSFNPTAEGTQAEGRYLTRDYTYDDQGNRASVTEPSGKRVVYSHDAQGRVQRQDVFMGSERVRARIFEYDVFGRVARETTPELSGKGYHLPAVQRDHQVTAKHQVTAGSMLFQIPAQIDHVVRADGQEQTRTTETYDEQGRLVTEERRAGSRVRTTTYGYGAGQVATFAQLRLDGTVDPAKGRTAVQAADLQVSKTVGGVTTLYTYDTSGQVAVETVKDGLLVRYDGDQAVYQDHHVLKSHDGLGHLVSEAVFTGPADRPEIGKASVTRYYGTGEIRDQWEGDPENVTVYQYGRRGTTAGKLVRMSRGVGLDEAQETAKLVRSSTDYTYDHQGRQVGSVSSTGLKTALVFDTLDRLVSELQPSGTTVTTTYHASGVPERITERAADGQRTTIRAVDPLGRVTLEQVEAGPLKYEVRRRFDAHDNPVWEQDSRLDMNRAGDDQATFRVYDPFGRLVKDLGPALNSDASQSAYVDDRRTYTEYAYDGLGRLTEKRQLLSGSMSPTRLTLDAVSNMGAGEVAVTRMDYDDFDRLIKVTDPAGYVKTMTYDQLGHLVQEQQDTIKAGDQLQGLATTTAVTRYAYDSAGRQIQKVDALGRTTQTVYNALGLPIRESDARGVTVKLLTYTPDGLLTGVAEPEINAKVPGSPAAAALQVSNSILPSGFVWTQRLTYGAHHQQPVATCVALMDQGAEASRACSTTTYDPAGRPLVTVYPDGTSTQRLYSAQGRLMREVGQDGRVTTFTYDTLGRVVTAAVQPGAADKDAGFVQGQTTRYAYNGRGQVTRQTVNGVSHLWQYNSAGQVIASTQPATDAVTAALQVNTYRLDGHLTAQSSFGYQGALRGGADRQALEGQGTPAITSGGLTVWKRNARGDLMSEARFVARKPGDVAVQAQATFKVDGLGQVVRREFKGDPEVYRAPLGEGAQYTTYYQRDAAGQLTRQWDEALGQRLNIQEFTYTPSGQVSTYKHQFTLMNNDRVLADSSSTTSAAYNARGLLSSSTVTPAQGQAQTTTYTYYASAALRQTAVQGGNTLTYTAYDVMGRPLTAQTQAKRSGQNGSAVPVDLHWTYSPDGTVTEKVTAAGDCLYQRQQQAVVGARFTRLSEWKGGCHGTPTTLQATRYNETGTPSQVETVTRVGSAAVTVKQTFTYDTRLNPTAVTLNRQDPARAGGEVETMTVAAQGSAQLVKLQRMVDGKLTASGASANVFDGFGRLLAIQNGTGTLLTPLSGYKLRYDADQRPAQLFGPVAKDGSQHLVAFRYDHTGTPMLMAEADLKPNGGSSRAYVAFGLPQAPQLLTLQAAGVTRVRDNTFTLAESALGEAWSELAPLNLGANLGALQAAPALTSERFGVQPLTLQPPAVGVDITPLLGGQSTPRAAGAAMPQGLGALEAAPSSLRTQDFGVSPLNTALASGPLSATAPAGTAGTGVSANLTGFGLTVNRLNSAHSLLDEVLRLQQEQLGVFKEN